MWLAQEVQSLSGLQPASQFPWVPKDVPQTTGSSLQSMVPHSCLAITPSYFLAFYNKQQGGMLETRCSPRLPSATQRYSYVITTCQTQHVHPLKSSLPAQPALPSVSRSLFSPLQDGLSSPPTPIALLYVIWRGTPLW